MLGKKHEWRALTFTDVQRRLRPLVAPWWFAAGVLTDLSMGQVVGDHDDLDIQALRKDQPVIEQGGWNANKARQTGLGRGPTARIWRRARTRHGAGALSGLREPWGS
jgi:hypothetical protein